MFEVFCYAIAILTVLLFIGEAKPEPVPVVDDLPSLEELMVEAKELTAKPVPAIAASVAAPVAIARVEVSVSPKMTVPQLREECDRLEITWQNARGKGKHMLKGDMLEAIAAVG